MGFEALFYFTVSKRFGNLLAEYLPIVLKNLSSQADANVIIDKGSWEGFALEAYLVGGFAAISSLAFTLYKSFHAFLFKKVEHNHSSNFSEVLILCSATRAYNCHKAG